VPGNCAGPPSAVWCVGGRLPSQLGRRHPSRMDADEQFPAARLRHRSCARDQGGSIGGIVKAHDSHRSHGRFFSTLMLFPSSEWRATWNSRLSFRDVHFSGSMALQKETHSPKGGLASCEVATFLADSGGRSVSLKLAFAACYRGGLIKVTPLRRAHPFGRRNASSHALLPGADKVRISELPGPLVPRLCV
jgi:hypothetical protein